MSPPSPVPPARMLTHWLTLRQAKDALRAGRPDDAHRLLDPLLADGHRKAVRLLREVAVGYVVRGERSLRADDGEAAWRELLAAETLNTGEPRAAELRQALTRVGLAECRAALEAGKPTRTVAAAGRLRDRHVRSPELDSVEDAAHDWVLATEMADRGDFPLARAQLERLRRRLGGIPPTGVDGFLADLDARHAKFRDAMDNLAAAADRLAWREAARWADEVIAAAPAHRDARQTQLRAWQAAQPDTGSYHANGAAAEPAMAPSHPGQVDLYAATKVPVRLPASGGRPPPESASGHRPETAQGADAPRSPGPGPVLPKRFLLWVDGVGGYLVCLSNRVSFGQATADGPIDVPLFADVSRLHAELSRDGEGYLLESARGAAVNGTSAEKAVLRCGDRVTLGASCQFLFRQPVPVSPSARLELVSGHRLPLAVDGVLLMADNLILGSGSRVHVTVPWLPANVVLYRSKDGLGVRWDGAFTVDGRPAQGRAAMGLPAVVASDAFSFAVEPVGPRL